MSRALNSYIAGWSDPRGISGPDGDRGPDGIIGITRSVPAPGYNPSMRRKTCSKCSTLTWHDNGECTECV